MCKKQSQTRSRLNVESLESRTVFANMLIVVLDARPLALPESPPAMISLSEGFFANWANHITLEYRARPFSHANTFNVDRLDLRELPGPQGEERAPGTNGSLNVSFGNGTQTINTSIPNSSSAVSLTEKPTGLAVTSGGTAQLQNSEPTGASKLVTATVSHSNANSQAAAMSSLLASGSLDVAAASRASTANSSASLVSATSIFATFTTPRDRATLAVDEAFADEKWSAASASRRELADGFWQSAADESVESSWRVRASEDESRVAEQPSTTAGNLSQQPLPTQHDRPAPNEHAGHRQRFFARQAQQAATLLREGGLVSVAPRATSIWRGWSLPLVKEETQILDEGGSQGAEEASEESSLAESAFSLAFGEDSLFWQEALATVACTLGAATVLVRRSPQDQQVRPHLDDPR